MLQCLLAHSNDLRFWSDEANHCTLPGCESAAITVTISVEVTVISKIGDSYTGQSLYAFVGDSYIKLTGTSNADPSAYLRLPDLII